MLNAIGYQRWEKLLFLHWEIPERALRSLVPQSLTIDTFEGKAYVGLIPFTMPDVKLASWSPSLSFHETNLRTYVRDKADRSGIFFFSLDAASVLAVMGARIFFGLPYFAAKMEMQEVDNQVSYQLQRVGSNARLDLRYVRHEALGPARPNTLEHFLVERYSLFVERLGILFRCDVRHAPYSLERAELQSLDETLLSTAKIDDGKRISLVLYSPGVSVEILPLGRA